MAGGDPAKSVEVAVQPARESGQVAETVVADKANDHSKRRPKVTPTTAVAAVSDCAVIDPFVVLLGERWISQHCSTS
mgnify:CR=1 FL=1